MNVAAPDVFPIWSDFQFAGWVPCVTGRLSFSAIGSTPGSRPYKVRRFCELGESLSESSNYPQLAVFQRRPNADFAWPQRAGGLINEWFENRGWRGLFRSMFPAHSTCFYLFHARLDQCPAPEQSAAGGAQLRIDAKGALAGKIWIIRKGTFFSNRKLVHCFEAFMLADVESRAKKWDEFCAASATMDKNCVSVRMYRSGELRMKIASEELPWIPNQGEDAERDPPHQVRQAYYFLKDCTHSHYHHHAHADQILRIRNSAACAGDEEEDLLWRRETLWDLARAAINMRRERQIFRRRDALGVVAYAQAFQSTLAKVKRIKGTENLASVDIVVKYDFDHLKQSMGAENDSASFRTQGSTSIILASFALLMTLIVMHHSASSILVGATDREVCILNPDATRWLALAVMLMFATIWDLNFHQRSVARSIRRLLNDGRMSLARSPIALPLGTAFLAAVFAVSWCGWLPFPDFALTWWRAINPLCLA